MPTRLQITAFFFIRAIGIRKTEQSLRKIEQKKLPPTDLGRENAGRGARGVGRRAARFLDIGVIQIMWVVGHNIGSAELPIW